MRVALVNNSHKELETLKRVLGRQEGLEVAWIARSGAEAVEKCKLNLPDLLLMDLDMPLMDGAEATRAIMKNTPCNVLIVASNVEAEPARVFKAMGYGAKDAVSLPVAGAAGSISGAEPLLNKISTLGKLSSCFEDPARPMAAPLTTARKTPVLEAPAIEALKRSERPMAKPVPKPKTRLSWGKTPIKPLDGIPPLIAIGSSTGGPTALCTVLSAFPEDFPVAMVIIQHVDQSFASGLTRWLDSQVPFTVREARTGDRPMPGVALVASTNDHLVIGRGGTMAYVKEPADQPYRPSVDVFFDSLAASNVPPCVAMVLTGMGADGAKGLLELRKKGWRTIAQDNSTSVVYGMPRIAAEIGAAQAVLPIGNIGPAARLHVEKLYKIKGFK